MASKKINNSDLKFVILAGGSGTRLWPLSRKSLPKQFIKLKEIGGNSLFQESLKVANYLCENPENIYVVASKDNFFHVGIQSKEIGMEIKDENILFQLETKDTLAVTSLAAKEIGGNLMILYSDHIIGNLDRLKEAIDFGKQNVEEDFITFGLKPHFAETGYGYIQMENAKEKYSKVKKFHQKPDEKTAEKYIKDGFLWNSGMCMINSELFKKELYRLEPKFYKEFFETKKPYKEIFENIEEKSLDSAIFEHTKNISCYKLDLYWTDLGSFDAITEFGNSDKSKELQLENNKKCFRKSKTIKEIGNVKNVNVISEIEKKEVGLIDVEDLIIVDTDDALLIAKAGSSQKVKKLLEQIEGKEPKIIYRPWGTAKIINEGKGFQTKSIKMFSGGHISTQMHYHRSEHWIVVSGTAKLTIGDEEIILTKGMSAYAPAGTKHKIENPGKIDLILMETRIGDYIEEDDIIRFEDDYFDKFKKDNER